MALIHQRPSEIEGITTGPLAEILNYTTGVSFEGFAVAESKCLYQLMDLLVIIIIMLFEFKRAVKLPFTQTQCA